MTGLQYKAFIKGINYSPFHKKKKNWHMHEEHLVSHNHGSKRKEIKRNYLFCLCFIKPLYSLFFFFFPWYLFYSLVETLGSFRIEAACYTWKMLSNMHSFVLMLFATKDCKCLLVSLHFTEIKSWSCCNSLLSCCNEGQELNASERIKKAMQHAELLSAW